MKFSAVFQNIDGDGLPTLGGDIVATVESPLDKGPLMRRIRSFSRAKGISWRFYFPGENYRLALGWLDPVFQGRNGHVVPVHRAGRRPPTPRRDFLIQSGEIAGWTTAVIVGHAVNSAWAPRWKPTTWRRNRRRLWWDWWNTLTALLARHHDRGHLVIVLVDGNKPGAWHPPGMVEVAGHGPDRVFITRDHPSNLRALRVQHGPKTGDGRVTHGSIRVLFEIDQHRGPR